MKTILLKRLTLSNWRSLNLDVVFNAQETRICAKNGVGKSSLQFAWNWLLSGYTESVYPKNYDLFDRRVALSHETPLASVKAEVSVDGVNYTLEKRAQAKFVRKRGENTYEKAPSDTYTHYIDNIETSISDFNSWVKHNICDPDLLVFCLDGSFFSALAYNDKHKARKVLENIIGEINQNDFKQDYSELYARMAKGYTLEQITEQIKNVIKPLKERMELIPTIVDNQQATLSEYESIDFEAIEKDIASKRKSIEDIDAAILGKAESIKPILGKRDAIFDIINSKALIFNERKSAWENQQYALTSRIKGQIDVINKENKLINERNDLLLSEYKRQEKSLEYEKNTLDNLNKQRDELLKKRDEVKARCFAEDTCAYCGQELPIEMLEKAKTRFLEQNNKDLDLVVSQGKNVKAQIEDCEVRIAKLEEVLSKGVTLEELKSVETLQAELKQAQESFVPFEQTNEYWRLQKELDELKASLPEIPQNDNEALTNAKRSLFDEIETQSRKLGLKDKANEIRNGIEALHEELREVGNAVARHEGVLSLIEQYNEEKANIISLRVNEHLAISQIVMYRKQKDGSLAPDCVVCDEKGVSYATMNNSKRPLVNIELQKLFCNYFNIVMPVFIDEVSLFDADNEPHLETQSIKLFASNDLALKIQ